MARKLSGLILGMASICVALSDCMSIGPQSVPRDRFDYAEAVADSWKSQMLLNLVKIRYDDAPVFLDVGQIVAGYSFNQSLGATAGTNFFNSDAAQHAQIATFPFDEQVLSKEADLRNILDASIIAEALKTRKPGQ